MDGAFIFKVLPSANDSIRILLRTIRIWMFNPFSLPSVGKMNCIWRIRLPVPVGSGEADYMRTVLVKRWRSDVVHHPYLMGHKPELQIRTIKSGSCLENCCQENIK